jgi:hypothetical protein
MAGASPSAQIDVRCSYAARPPPDAKKTQASECAGKPFLKPIAASLAKESRR